MRKTTVRLALGLVLALGAGFCAGCGEGGDTAAEHAYLAKLADLHGSWQRPSGPGRAASAVYLAIHPPAARKTGDALELLYDAGLGSFTLTGSGLQTGNAWHGTFVVGPGGPSTPSGVIANGATLDVTLTMTSASGLTSAINDGSHTQTETWTKMLN